VKITALSTMQNIVRPNDARNETRKTETRPSGDAYQPSGAATLFNIARKAIAAAPDVRQGKVESLQAKFQNGEYDITPWDIAAKLVDARV
jgi:negative regulator of flagellin synthesis FlgM